ncbi:MAG TPA: cytochrome P450 [Acidimicrobiales bacterium]|nr:cytochrome P450 [Acidimicrobiales bacterium]
MAPSLAEIDLTDLDLFATRMPHDWFDLLRREAPVWRHPETAHEEAFWVVSTYDRITEVHRSGLDYSHQTGPGRDGKGGISLNDVSVEMGVGSQMVMTDPPKHTELRKLVNRGFTPRMVSRLTQTMRLRTDIIIDRVAQQGSADFVVDVACELPLMAIADIVGVPMEDRGKLFTWTNQVLGSNDPEFQTERGPEAYEVSTGMMSLFGYSRELANKRRAEPADDLWTRLIGATATMEDGTVVELSALEQDMFFSLLILAGNETTRNAISGGLVAFLEHRDQWQLLGEQPELIDTAVDEILRYTSPVNYFRRTAAVDRELGGQPIRAGEKVTLWYPSGNRDESVFVDPHRFDITRSPNHHMAFGAGGPHYCLGASLAKLELKVMFEGLVKRLPDIEATGPAERLRNNLLNSIKHLPVKFTPVEPVLSD